MLNHELQFNHWSQFVSLKNLTSISKDEIDPDDEYNLKKDR
jgi:hypothetical protein